MLYSTTPNSADDSRKKPGYTTIRAPRSELKALARGDTSTVALPPECAMRVTRERLIKRIGHLV